VVATRGSFGYRACLATGVDPRFDIWDGTGLATDFVWSLNYPRRHLDGGAKALAAARYAVELERGAKDRQGGSGRFGGGSAPIDAEPDFGRSPAEGRAER
jgi:hypothetical protein